MVDQYFICIKNCKYKMYLKYTSMSEYLEKETIKSDKLPISIKEKHFILQDLLFLYIFGTNHDWALLSSQWK